MDSLKVQLERARLERGLSVAESMADHRALLTTAELARINNILTGIPPTSREGDDPWRREPVTLTLPSGTQETFALIPNFTVVIREKLHRATELAEAGHVIEAAVDAYAGLVRTHAFKDANRRTAVVAAHYFLKRYGQPLSGMALHELGLGDVRDPGQLEALRETMRQMAKFASKRGSEQVGLTARPSLEGSSDSESVVAKDRPPRSSSVKISSKATSTQGGRE